MFRFAIPVLHVSSSVAAEAFYCTRLGFRRESVNRPDASRPDPCYMDVTRDGVWLHLSSFSGDGVPGGVVNLYVEDVDALREEFAAKGVRIHLEPTDQTWGTREMYVKDPDGNSLRFIGKTGS